jgi:hypothetical protein
MRRREFITLLGGAEPKGRAEALYVVGDALVITHRIRINTLALAARLPTIHVIREFVERAANIVH